MKQTCSLICTILMGALLISGLIFGTKASAADQNPCSEDMAKFCKDVKPGQRAMVDCLERHESQLSDACKDYEAKMEKARVESREVQMQQMRVRQACKDDVSKLCSDIKSGSAATNTCLKEHSSELSVPCRNAVEAAKGGAEEKTKK